MQKPAALKRGDQVAIVSLSSGSLGEAGSEHQLRRGLARLQQLGLVPMVMPNALRGRDYLAAHPEDRAADLKRAFLADEIKGIICAIGGDDTYRLAPLLMTDPEFVQAVREHPKLVTGFSDTTVNHLMFYRLGLQTFYGPNFLNDFAELAPTLLPYTAKTIQHYFKNPATTRIESSPVWYEERKAFGPSELDQPRVSHLEKHHYDVLRGSGRVTGRLLGGRLDSFYDLLTNTRYPDEALVAQQFQLVPTVADWQGRVLFIETSDEQPNPDLFETMLAKLEAVGILGAVAGIIVGKPQNERYYDAYRDRLLAATEKWHLPILMNVNFGHAYPRTALPYGALTTVDFDAATMTIEEPYFSGPVTRD